MPHSPQSQPAHSSRGPHSLANGPRSGKGAGDENFPVASRLIDARLRPHVMTYYRFARTADDIADSPELSAADKLALLASIEERLGDDSDNRVDAVSAMRDSLATTAVAPDRCLDLLYAFMQDARKSRRENWDDLMDYCRLSANPVGRYLLDLHGEDRSAYPASDALCSALQVLNHLQDCGRDYRSLQRVYLPLDWLIAEGLTEEILLSDRAPDALRRVIAHCLDEVDGLLTQAAPLPGRLRNRGLAMEASIILRLARLLSRRLRGDDPLATHVTLTKLDFLSCGLRGVAAVLAGRCRAWRGTPEIPAAGRHDG